MPTHHHSYLASGQAGVADNTKFCYAVFGGAVFHAHAMHAAPDAAEKQAGNYKL